MRIYTGKLFPAIITHKSKESTMRCNVLVLFAIVLTGCSEDVLQSVIDFDPENHTPDEVYEGEVIDEDGMEFQTESTPMMEKSI